MSEYIERNEHEEFRRRMEEEHKRQNHRIGVLEETVHQIGELTISVREIALSTKSMSEEQKALRADMEEMKGRDGQKWRKTIEDIVKILLGIFIGHILKQIGIV